MLPDITARLRHLVAASPLPIAKIANAYARAGGSRTHLYEIVAGKRVDPSIRTVQRVLAAIEQPWSALDTPDPVTPATDGPTP